MTAKRRCIVIPTFGRRASGPSAYRLQAPQRALRNVMRPVLSGTPRVANAAIAHPTIDVPTAASRSRSTSSSSLRRCSGLSPDSAGSERVEAVFAHQAFQLDLATVEEGNVRSAPAHEFAHQA